jgi:hypothetical protein
MARARQRLSTGALYSVHPGVQMMQDWVATLPEKTGRTLEQWVQLVVESGPAETKARREWLKKEHHLGTNSAWWIVDKAESKDGTWDDDPEAYLEAAAGYVEAMFAGGKAGLRPLYDRLLRLALGVGPDVKACPCKTIVPLYRNHVFAQLKPTTRTRLDLGLALKGVEAPERLIDTGGAAKGDRLTHRIPIQCEADIDDEVQCWLRAAYERDA